MGPYGALRDYSNPYGSIWNHTGSYRTIRDHTGPYGTISDHAGPYRPIYMGSYWSIQDHIGPYRTIGAILDHKDPTALLRILILPHGHILKTIKDSETSTCLGLRISKDSYIFLPIPYVT